MLNKSNRKKPCPLTDCKHTSPQDCPIWQGEAQYLIDELGNAPATREEYELIKRRAGINIPEYLERVVSFTRKEIERKTDMDAPARVFDANEILHKNNEKRTIVSLKGLLPNEPHRTTRYVMVVGLTVMERIEHEIEEAKNKLEQAKSRNNKFAIENCTETLKKLESRYTDWVRKFDRKMK